VKLLFIHDRPLKEIKPFSAFETLSKIIFSLYLKSLKFLSLLGWKMDHIDEKLSRFYQNIKSNSFFLFHFLKWKKD